jgi:hypothetical protein
VATLRPSEQSILLTVAILCALPWSLLLLLLDFSHGFADRAAVVVCMGLCANVALLWWSTALLRALSSAARLGNERCRSLIKFQRFRRRAGGTCFPRRQFNTRLGAERTAGVDPQRTYNG